MFDEAHQYKNLVLMIKLSFKSILILISSSVFIALVSYIFYNQYFLAMKPEIFYNPSNNFAKLVLEKCDTLKQSFSPPFWAASSFMQTIIPTMLRSRLPRLLYSREMLSCPDGGILSLDWLEDAANTEKQERDRQLPPSPIALLFPGLIGDSQSDYLRHIAPRLKKLGYRVVALNNRGRGGMELRSPRLYNADNIEDYEHVINHLRERNPTCKIVASGFSMGAMLLTRYLAENQKESKIDAAMLVSANYDLVNGTKNMETGWFNRFIAKIMTKELARIILAAKAVLSRAEKPVKWAELESATTFRQLDEYFTCPMWDFPNPEAYFQACTNNDRMKQIKVPTLCLNSADDMFSPFETLPVDRLSDTTVFAITKRGGHLGFADGWPTMPYYGDRLIEQFYAMLLKVDSFDELQKTTATATTNKKDDDDSKRQPSSSSNIATTST